MFGVFQSKLIGSIMDFDLDVVNPEEEEQEEGLESGESLSRHLKIHSGEKLNKCNQCDFASFYAGNPPVKLTSCRLEVVFQ